MIRLMGSHHPGNMKTPAVLLLLRGCVLLLSALTVSAVSLQVSPNLQMFFRGSSSVSLGCVDDYGQTAEGWMVKRLRGGPTEDCGSGSSDFVRVNNSFCALDLFVSSGGNFLCEDSSGQQSDEVSIRISDEGVILEIPALPVRTGSNVTLHCRNRHGSAVAAYFHFNKSRVGPKSELIITNVKQSDEDFYWCSSEESEQSPLGFLRIREPPPPAPLRVSVLRLFCHLVVFCLYCISAGLLLSICCSRKTANKPAVTMEMSHHDGGSQRLDEEHNITVDDITEYEF